MSIELKVKSKHLGEEARIIKFEEKRVLKRFKENQRRHKESGVNEHYHPWKDPYWNMFYSLYLHRTQDVRNENRATFLARAFLKGVPYKTVEQSRKDDGEYQFWNTVIPRALKLINKYGKKKIEADELKAWINE